MLGGELAGLTGLPSDITEIFPLFVTVISYTEINLVNNRQSETYIKPSVLEIERGRS